MRALYFVLSLLLLNLRHLLHSLLHYCVTAVLSELHVCLKAISLSAAQINNLTERFNGAC